jgi:Uma2 family endonuclease
MVNPLVRRDVTASWSVDDLAQLPNDEYRYEISDGSLIVTPPPGLGHARVVIALTEMLRAVVPEGAVVAENVGVIMSDGRTVRVPDALIFDRTVLAVPEAWGVRPDQVRLAVEVASPSNAGDDLIVKRHQYAVAGIPHYWVADPRDRTLLVLTLDEHHVYRDVTLAKAGDLVSITAPVRLTLDPATLFGPA